MEQEREGELKRDLRKGEGPAILVWLRQPSLTVVLGLGPGWRAPTNEASGFKKIKIISHFSLL